MNCKHATRPSPWRGLVTSLVLGATMAALGLVGQGQALGQTDTQEANFRAEALAVHNAKRALYLNTPPLALAAATDALNTGAQSWALHLAQIGKLEHSDSMGAYGENIAVAYDTANLDAATVADKAVTSWYNEASNYDYNNPGFSSDTGHFTQVVWVSTTTLGGGYAIGQATINGVVYNAFYSVCRYYPAGNVEGQFETNVQPPAPDDSSP